jgi:acyl-CoA reductase-like NAD-dependent aldehyde dehydrogenase
MPAFLERFVARVRALRVGDSLSPDTEVGPLINPREVDRVESWVTEAAASGAKIVAGGKRRSATIMEPTVLVEPAPDARVSREEIFGPVCCVYEFDQLDEAIAKANSLPVAFQASIFANDIGAALYAADRLDASAVMINDHTAFRTDWMPFAGRRESGYGVGGIPFSMREMTQEKMRVFRYCEIAAR